MALKFGYARISDQQDQESIDANIKEQQKILLEHGCTFSSFDTITYPHEGKFSARLSLIDNLREGDAIYVTRLGMFASNLGDLFQAIEDIHDKGGKLVSIYDKIDTSHTPVARVLDAVREFSKYNKNEKTRQSRYHIKMNKPKNGRRK